MAGLPLYLIAIPLRRSFAAAIAKKFLVDGRKLRERGRYTRLEQLQACEVLRIDNAHWHAVVIHHDEIVDAMAFQ